MTKFRKFLHIVFEKYGVIKLFGAAILGLLFFWLFDRTGQAIFRYLSWPFAIFIGVDAVILFIYAAIINPINARKKKKG